MKSGAGTISIPPDHLALVLAAARIEAARLVGLAAPEPGDADYARLLDRALGLACQADAGHIGINTSAILRHAAARTLGLGQAACAGAGTPGDGVKNLAAALGSFPFSLRSLDDGRATSCAG